MTKFMAGSVTPVPGEGKETAFRGRSIIADKAGGLDPFAGPPGRSADRREVSP
jgi:hypothetical protein